MNDMTDQTAYRTAAPRRPHVKICGLRDEAMIDLALSRGASDVGFIHFAKSPRHLSLDEMARLTAHVGERALVSVVTVDADDALVGEIAERVRPHILQLHGAETPERVEEIAARTGLKTTKAIAVANAADLQKIARYVPVAHRILLDAKAPKGAALPGGNGVSFDWSLLSALPASLDYMLSGGLSADNVGEAVRRLAPWGLDVSSGVESAPGVKDPERIAAFITAARAVPA
jgi:phosphoribosylanthranilate isomerase